MWVSPADPRPQAWPRASSLGLDWLPPGVLVLPRDLSRPFGFSSLPSPLLATVPASPPGGSSCIRKTPASLPSFRGPCWAPVQTAPCTPRRFSHLVPTLFTVTSVPLPRAPPPGLPETPEPSARTSHTLRSAPFIPPGSCLPSPLPGFLLPTLHDSRSTSVSASLSLSVSASLSLRLCLCVSVSLSPSLCLCLSLHLCVTVSLCVSVFLSLPLSPSMRLSVSVSVTVSLCLSVSVPVSLSHLCLSLCLLLCLRNLFIAKATLQQCHGERLKDRSLLPALGREHSGWSSLFFLFSLGLGQRRGG